MNEAPGSSPTPPASPAGGGAQHAARNYAIVTAAYWGFTLTDGALRMLVLLHFYRLGYSPFTLALLFLLYEAAGVLANLVVDAPHKDLRRARSSLLSLAPTTTGSATAIALIYPELKGKLNGHAVRAPVLNASLTDCVFELQRATTVEEVNALFKAAAEGPLAGILGYEERPLVSVDYARDTRSSIVDALSTMVTDGTLLKVYAWYDNEMGYACRMVDLACHMERVGL